MKVSFNQYIPLSFLLVSFIGYILTPRTQEFSYTIYYMTIAVAISSLIFYYKCRNKNNFLDFDTLFITICYLIGYFATFFYNQPYYKAFFIFEFNYSYLNSGAWLFTIGMNAYFCGSLFVKSNRKVSNKKVKIYPTQILYIINIGLMFAFIMCGGIGFYQRVYADAGGEGGGITVYVQLLLSIISIMLIVIEIRNKFIKKDYKIHYAYFITIILFALLLLYLGNRTTASMLILPMIGLLTHWFKPIKFRFFIIFLILGIFSMWIVQQLRTGEQVRVNISYPALMLMDMTIPSRTIYESMEIVDSEGLNYGKTMFSPIIGVVPGLAGIILGKSGYGSAELFTKYAYEKFNVPVENQIGLGSTIISDIYLSFGVVGVILFMWLLGRTIHIVELNSKYGDLFSSFLLGVFLANSVFWARTSYAYPARLIVWGSLLMMIYLSIIFTYCKYKNHE
nr:O-antigen polymerase [uncultured Bacteroides sp.]